MTTTPVTSHERSDHAPGSAVVLRRSPRWVGSWRTGVLVFAGFFVLLLTFLTGSVRTGAATVSVEEPVACHESCDDTDAGTMPSSCLHDARCGAQLPASGSTMVAVGVLGAALSVAAASGPSLRVAPRDFAVLGRDVEGRLFRPPRLI